MLRPLRDLALLCVEAPLRTIPKGASVVECLAETAATYVRKSENPLAMAPFALSLSFTYHIARGIEEYTTPLLDRVFSAPKQYEMQRV